MDLDLRGRQALVCGGSQGIGLASAIELASMGAQVVLLARDPVRLAAAADSLPAAHGQAHGWIDADLAHGGAPW